MTKQRTIKRKNKGALKRKMRVNPIRPLNFEEEEETLQEIDEILQKTKETTRETRMNKIIQKIDKENNKEKENKETSKKNKKNRINMISITYYSNNKDNNANNDDNSEYVDNSKQTTNPNGIKTFENPSDGDMAKNPANIEISKNPAKNSSNSYVAKNPSKTIKNPSNNNTIKNPTKNTSKDDKAYQKSQKNKRKMQKHSLLKLYERNTITLKQYLAGERLMRDFENSFKNYSSLSIMIRRNKTKNNTNRRRNSWSSLIQNLYSWERYSKAIMSIEDNQTREIIKDFCLYGKTLTELDKRLKKRGVAELRLIYGLNDLAKYYLELKKEE
jgi:hypothetical protein